MAVVAIYDTPTEVCGGGGGAGVELCSVVFGEREDKQEKEAIFSSG